MITVPIHGYLLELKGLSSSCKLLYSTLLYYDADKEPLQISIDELTEILGVSRNTIKRSMRELRNRGMVERYGKKTEIGKFLITDRKEGLTE